MDINTREDPMDLHNEARMLQLEDGSVEFDFTDVEEEQAPPPDHDANLADFMEEEDLIKLGSDLVSSVEADDRTRADWRDTYITGLALLGFKTDERTEPWLGANGVYHPLLAEAVVQFKAQAMSELFPASGPAKTKVLGKTTPEITAQAERMSKELNYQLTDKMPEYRDEMEQMLFRLPLAGSSFKKIYFDPVRRRPVAMFVPAEDFIVDYGTSDLETSERYTHRLRRTPIYVEQMQRSGFFRAVDLPAPSPIREEVQDAYDGLSGTTPSIENDDRHQLLEIHTLIDLEIDSDYDGQALPYVITVDRGSRTVLAVRRNWDESAENPTERKTQYFTHYRYLPGMGFYGTGLIHLIGGLASSATSLMRQLIDAGTLSNLPGGLKARGMRIKGDNNPIKPGEFRDVDVPGGTIKENIAFLPYKEPSAVLYQLLGNVVEEGRRIGSIADMDVGNMNPEAPVGTTLALLERTLKVMSGVQARCHASLGRELKLLARVIHEYMPPKYDFVGYEEFDRVNDFDGRVDVIPVSDPNAATMAQRVVQYQTALQLSAQAPQVYNIAKLHRGMVEVLGLQDPDEIVKLPEDIKPRDPVTENMAILKQEPVQSFPYQDHEAHIAVHTAMAQDPKIQQMVGQSPFASAIQSAMASHITEHIAAQYRVEIQKQLGVPMPDETELLPEDLEREVSQLAAQAAGKLQQKNAQEAADEQKQKEEQDPLNIIQREELAIKKAEAALEEKKAVHNALNDVQEMALKEKKQQADIALQKERLESDRQRDAASIGARLATQLDASQRKERTEGAKMGVSIGKELAKNEVTLKTSEARKAKPPGAKDK